MKSRILNFFLCLCLGASLIVFQSCEKEGDEPVPLVADAGEDFTAAALTTVQLDGTGSTPANEIGYEWDYSGPVPIEQINFSGQGTATPTFTPPRNGEYSFTLTITRSNEFTTDHVIVSVEGFIDLSTVTQNTTLKDIEPDPNKPDYKISNILVLNGTANLTANSADIYGLVIEVSESAGIHVTGGHHSFTNVKFMSPSGWKGIKVDEGSLKLAFAMIEKGGKSLFENSTEAAAITINSGYLDLTSSTFAGTTGYDLLMTNVSSSHVVNGNVFSAVKPIKAPIAMMSRLGYNNAMPSTYDYITLTTPGAGTFVTSPDSEFRFSNGKKYYIDGDFTANQLIVIEQNVSILVKEDAGIVAGQGIYVSNSTGSKATIEGINSSAWKGLLLTASQSHAINGLIIKKAGSSTFNTGSLTSDTKAAIYNLGTAGFQHLEVLESQGYGIVWASQTQPSGLKNSTFTGSASAAIRVPISLVDWLLPENHNNTFTLSENIPAVELYGNSLHSGTNIWRSVNGNNFYLATTNILLSANLTLSPGLRLRFASTRYMTGSGVLIAKGTTEAPIILEGPADSPGSWPGILLEGLFNIEHCQIKNGGQSLMFGATAAAALVIKYTGGTNAANYTFKNNTVTGSTGLGVLIELGGKDPGIDDPANNNTYSNNTAGNTLKK
jgi:hypothetical protein